MPPMVRRLVGLAAAAALLSGCATTWPVVTSMEYQQASAQLQAKALEFRFRQMLRVQTVGMRLVTALPPSVRVPSSPYVGLILSPLDPAVARVFGLPAGPAPYGRRGRRAVVVTGVVPGSPGDRAGIRAGDLLVRVNGRFVETVDGAVAELRRLTPNAAATFALERAGVPQETPVAVGVKPYPVGFQVVTDGEEAELWNAWASPGQITVTNRLLEFMHSDDELAVVMGHELAHLTQGHIVKGFGTSLLGSVLAAAVAQATDVSVLGDVAGGAVQSAFSRDFERQADYVGLRYAFQAGYDIRVGPRLWERVATELPQRAAIPLLATHPSEPERMIRLQKTVEEITAGSGAAPAPRPPHHD